MHQSFSLTLRLSYLLSLSLSIYMLTNLLMYQSTPIYLPIYIFTIIYPSICLEIYILPIYLDTNLYVYQSIWLQIYMFAHLSVYNLSILQYIYLFPPIWLGRFCVCVSENWANTWQFTPRDKRSNCWGGWGELKV